jgi:hypothetical protein
MLCASSFGTLAWRSKSLMLPALAESEEAIEAQAAALMSMPEQQLSATLLRLVMNERMSARSRDACDELTQLSQDMGLYDDPHNPLNKEHCADCVACGRAFCEAHHCDHLGIGMPGCSVCDRRTP